MIHRSESEQEILRGIMQGFDAAGLGLLWRSSVGHIRSRLPVGFSDLFGVCNDGRAVFIEVKTARGRVSPEQLEFIRAVKEKGARAGIARGITEALNIAIEP